jgi:hypothetical protein
VPLTPLQIEILAIIAVNRTPENYIAGGTVLHFEPNTTRYSRDLDIFHDALEAVAPSFEADRRALTEAGLTTEVIISQPGIIRAIVKGASDTTQIDWARDSAWRFMPVVHHEKGGFMLHEVDVAINKMLALAGRNEPRDYVDAFYIMEHILPLGALLWAAVAKDPGFTPISLLEQLKRQGRYRPQDIARLDLTSPFDLQGAKTAWLKALEDAESFITSRPISEVGCLYYDPVKQRFVAPEADSKRPVVPHYGRVGGILPRPS